VGRRSPPPLACLSRGQVPGTEPNTGQTSGSRDGAVVERNVDRHDLARRGLLTYLHRRVRRHRRASPCIRVRGGRGRDLRTGRPPIFRRSAKRAPLRCSAVPPLSGQVYLQCDRNGLTRRSLRFSGLDAPSFDPGRATRARVERFAGGVRPGAVARARPGPAAVARAPAGGRSRGY
jgi:hypothetical protein